jgi:hypothetical protein
LIVTKNKGKVGTLIENLKKPFKDFLVKLCTKAVWSILSAILLTLISMAIIRQFSPIKENFMTFAQDDFLILFALFYLISLSFFMINPFLSLFSDFLEAVLNLVNIKRNRRQFTLKISQKRFIFNSSKWAGSGLFALGTIIAILIFQESYLGFNIQLLFPYFLFSYFFGALFILFRNIILTNFEWMEIYLADFKESMNDQFLLRALRSYNRVLKASLSTRKLMIIAQNTAEAYKIADVMQKRELDVQIDTLLSSVKERNIPSIDQNIISLSIVAKSVTSEHKASLGHSIKYPFRLIAWEQTKTSLTKNYPKIVYLLLGIAILVILKQLNIIPNIFYPG